MAKSKEVEKSRGQVIAEKTYADYQVILDVCEEVERSELAEEKEND